ncbi:MAG TPA: Nif3-like dinuclear metal center hexameric protein, partial [Ruminococcaceae bacterium]|nr:Nif3-like dinuclear metal center hexameric protein [Oscillospiraceae bacterium]
MSCTGKFWRVWNMTKICELYEYINRIAPFDSAQTWDNSGLLLGDADLPCHCVLLALDITEDTVKQAKECSADLVITHHPVIFRPLSALSYHTPIAELISSKISVISAHTNLDIAVDGVNDALCRALNLQDL